MKKTAKIYKPKIKKKTAEASHAETKKEAKDKSEVDVRREKIDKKIADMQTEHGGRPKDKGLEPTRYDDWEYKGRCIDF